MSEEIPGTLFDFYIAALQRRRRGEGAVGGGVQWEEELSQNFANQLNPEFRQAQGSSTRSLEL